MKAYDVDLFLHLAQVFPAALNTSRVVDTYESRPGPWGIERVYTGTETEILAADILDTATATMRNYGKERALRYIDEFKPAKVQRAELLQFNRRHH